MRTAAIVLAAGAGSRFGGCKQLATVDGLPLVRRVVDICIDAGFEPVAVALGYEADRVATVLPATAVAVPVPDWQRGMGHSLAFSITQLPDEISHAMVVLADQAALTSDDIKQLLLASQRAPDNIVAATYSGTVGVPAIFPRHLFAELAALRGERGTKRVLQSRESGLVPVDMPRAALDVDTPDDLPGRGVFQVD